MMNKVWILSKVFLKSSFSGVLNPNKGARLKNIMIVLLILFSVGSLVGPIGLLINVLYDGFSSIGQEGALLAFLLAGCSLFIFIMGIVYVVTVYYFSSDVENLLPLPLKPYEIVGAKFVTVLVYEYFTEIVLLGPAFAVYGVKSGSDILYYIYAVIVFLILPMIPLIMASAIVMIVMRFTNIGRHRDKLRVVGAMTALFLGIGFNIFIQRQVTAIKNETELLNLVLSGKNSLVEIMSNIFPFTKFAALSMTADSMLKGLQYLVLFIIINIASVVIFTLLSEMLYFKGVIGGSEAYSKRKKLSNTEMQKGLIERSKLMASTIKELKILFRTPAYFINCVIMNFLWPFFILIPLMAQGNIMQNLNMLKAAGIDSQNYGFIIAGTFGMTLFISVSNAISSTAVSREGQNISISKYLPVSFEEQLTAKLLTAIVLGGSGLVVILLAGMFVIGIPFYVFAGMIASMVTGLVFTSLTGLFIDIKMPKLNWDNEQKAVKQNINVLINMLLAILIGAAVVILTGWLELSYIVVVMIIVALFGAIDFYLYKKLMTKGADMFSKIEV